MEESGDPFRFRLPRFLKPPKALRKLGGKAFRFAKKISPLAGLIPGLQPLAFAGRLGKFGKVASLAGRIKGGVNKAMQLRAFIAAARAQEAAQMEDEPDDSYLDEFEPEEVDFARSYGYEVGDPGSTPRRKSAAAGPKMKAAKKASKRATKRAGGGGMTGPQKRRPRGGARGRKVVGPDIAGGLAELAGKVGPEGLAALTSAASGRRKGSAASAFGMGKSRRTNVANVKALRRSLRRVDGFAKLAKKVQKDAAGILRHVDRQPRAVRGRGHKAGCRCVVCSRA
jgi:hypothetical protein